MRKPRAYAEDRSSGEIGDVFTKCGIGRQRPDLLGLCAFSFVQLWRVLNTNQSWLRLAFSIMYWSVYFDLLARKIIYKNPTSHMLWSLEQNGDTRRWTLPRKSSKISGKPEPTKLFWRTLLVPGSPTQGGYKNCPSHPKVEEGAPAGYWVWNI